MSDYDRNKFYGKKKYNSRDANNFGSRFFNSKSTFKGDKDFTKDSPSKGDGAQKTKQPTILIKTREPTEERSVSPKRNKDEQPVVTIAAPPTTESTTPNVPKQMKKCVKFLSDGMIYTESLQDYMLDNNDFLVVGVVGAQGVGKSTILNLLAQNSVTDNVKRSIFTDVPVKEEEDSEYFDSIRILSDNVKDIKIEDDDINNCISENLDNIFEVRGEEQVESCANTTQGVDLFITSNRVIFLDCQPINSVSVLHDLIRNDNSRNVIGEFVSLEKSGEIQSLQLTAFLMLVCHVLIVVQDYPFDSNILRFIQTAEMLKPTISSQEDEFVDHFPHLLLVHNRAQMDDFSPIRFKATQQLYRSIFSKTKLHLDSGMGLASGRITNSLSPKNCGEMINLFLIPEYNKDEENIYKGHPPLEDLVRRLRGNILGATRYPLTHVQLSERNWLLYCGKAWDHVKKSPFFVEYTKLIP